MNPSATSPCPQPRIGQWRLSDGTEITIRPIRPEDAGLEQTFVRGLSPESRFYRFMGTFRELSQDLLHRLTHPDHSREMALIALREQDGQESILGVARYSANPDGETAEFALVVADAWQHHGLGTHLMDCLTDAARERGLTALTGEVLAENAKMLSLMRELGFSLRTSADDPGVVVVTKRL